MGDATRTLGSDPDGDVPMSDMGLDSEETEEQDWSTIGAAAPSRRSVPTGKDTQPHTADQGARTRLSRPQFDSCRACDEPDNDSMVMCDDHVAHQFSGEAWFHRACVGLKPYTRPGEVWYCPPCEYEKIFRAFG